MPRLIRKNLGWFLSGVLISLFVGFCFVNIFSTEAQEQIKIFPTVFDGDWQNPEAAFSQDLPETAASIEFNIVNSAYPLEIPEFPIEEAATPPQEGIVFLGERSLELSNFSVPEDFGETKIINNAQLRLSLAGRGEVGDKLVINYYYQDSWQSLATFDLENEISNALNGGYFLYGLPVFENWTDLENLKIKFVYQCQENAEVYLDSLWLEITTAEQPQETPEEQPRQMGERRHFKSNEEPEFELKESFFAKIKSLFGKEKREIVLIGPDGKERLEGLIIQGNKIKILRPADERSFRPGLYKLKIKMGEEEIIQEFSWGVLAINTNKSIYLPNETAYLQMAVLRDDGHTICDVNLKLEIIPAGGEPFSATVEMSGECGPNNVTDVPDYFAYYQVGGAGTYQMELTNLDNGYEIEDSFEVRDSVPFEIERIGPTRIYPPASYEMTLRVKVNQDFAGEVIETMPADFEVVETSDKRQETKNGEKQIIWQVDWKARESYELKYTFDAPDNSPYLYLLGPLTLKEIGKEFLWLKISGFQFQEARQWQIASDATSLVYVGGITGSRAGSTTQGVTLSLTSLTGGISSSAGAGDIVIVAVATGSSADRSIGVSSPTNYTEEQELYSNSTNDTNLSVSWKIMGATPDTSVTTTASGNNADAITAIAHVWRGVDESTPFDVAETTATGTGTGRANPPAITPTTEGTMIVAIGAGAAATSGAVYTSSDLSNFRSVTQADTYASMNGVGSYAWTSGSFDPAQFGGGTTGSGDSWAAVTLALRSAFITVSGGCFTDDTELTACTDGGSDAIKVAVNGVVQTNSDATVDDNWSFTIPRPASGATMVFFRDGANTEAEEATTVTKYDGDKGNVTQVKMYQNQLVIGTDSGSTNSDQTISIADMDTDGNGYEWSDDPNVMYAVTAGDDLVVDANGDYTAETLYVISGDTYRPASGGGGDTTTHHLKIDSGAVITADSNTFYIYGNWSNSGTFTASAGTVTFNKSNGTQSISGNTTFNNFIATASTARTLQFAASSEQTVNGTWTITGSPNQLITLTTSSAPTQWKITPNAASVSYADVNYSYNTVGTICATFSQSTNDANTGWEISGGGSCVNNPPEVLSVSIDSDAEFIDLSLGETKAVVCFGTVQDLDGYEQITSVEAKLYRTLIGHGASDDKNNHYTLAGDSQCVPSNGSGSTEDYTCTFSVYYFADGTDESSAYESDNWTCRMMPSDGEGEGTAGTNIIEMRTLLALDIDITEINYDTMNPGTNTGSNNQVVNITNIGNVRIDVSFDGYGATDGDGYAMVCATGNIQITNEKYGMSDVTYDSLTWQLSDTTEERDWDIVQRINDTDPFQGEDKKYSYWGLAVPTGTKGLCSGTVNFTAVNDAGAD